MRIERDAATVHLRDVMASIGVLVEFRSVVEAVRCAIEVQKRHQRTERGRFAQSRMLAPIQLIPLS